jgi:colicin import membrane protein
MGALSAGGLIGSLSTAATVLKTLDSTFSAIQGFGSSAEKQAQANMLAQQDLALKQLQAQQALGQANAEQDAALQRQKIANDAASADATRMGALRRAVARQNAQFGASGVSSDDGSSEAVMLGLVNQSDAEKADQDALDTLRYQAIDQNLGQEKSVDVLQQAQLQQRQNLQNIIQGS